MWSDLPKGILLRELRGSGLLAGLVTSAAYTTKSALLFVVQVLIRSLLVDCYCGIELGLVIMDIVITRV